LSDPAGSVPSLQFDRAEFATPAAPVVKCASCNHSIIQSYYEAVGKTICATCREALASAADSGGTARLLRALMAGFGAAILGSIVWWGVRKVSGYEIGLISIGIGIGVGRAVQWGSRNRGGWAYQLLAVLLTYASIAGNYMPDVVTGILEQAKDTTKTAVAAPAAAGTPVKASAAATPSVGGFLLALGAVFLMAAAAPFLAGASNIIGLLIIGFGLWNAWKVNRRIDVVVNGPYSVVPAANV
jgi:ribosomal protein S27E